MAWRFGSPDRDGPFSWGTLGDGDYREVLEHLHQFENMEHRESEGSGSHAISLSDLSKAAQKRLEEIELDDIDELMSFRLSGKKRVFCVPQANIMQVLWWDPDHEVCPSKLKGT